MYVFMSIFIYTYIYIHIYIHFFVLIYSQCLLSVVLVGIPTVFTFFCTAAPLFPLG